MIDKLFLTSVLIVATGFFILPLIKGKEEKWYYAMTVVLMLTGLVCAPILLLIKIWS